MPLQKKVFRATTGYFGRATELGHNAKSTMVHLVQGSQGLCGYRPHPSMKLHVCAPYPELSYVECDKCKTKYMDAKAGITKEHRVALDELYALELALEGMIKGKMPKASRDVIVQLIKNKEIENRKFIENL